MSKMWYKLINRKCVPFEHDLDDTDSFLKEMSKHHRNVRKNRVRVSYIDEVKVSTVFLGLDHGIMQDLPPLLFETMIFNGRFEGRGVRCATWREALKMHSEMLQLVKTERRL